VLLGIFLTTIHVIFVMLEIVKHVFPIIYVQFVNKTIIYLHIDAFYVMYKTAKLAAMIISADSASTIITSKKISVKNAHRFAKNVMKLQTGYFVWAATMDLLMWIVNVFVDIDRN
jgi:hypothetical protein